MAQLGTPSPVAYPAAREGRNDKNTVVKMEFVVYIMYSISLGKYYVGQTQDINNRILQHNSGKGKYTSKGIPWRLIQTFECINRTEAVKLELKIKKRGIQRYLQDNNLQ